MKTHCFQNVFLNVSEKKKDRVERSFDLFVFFGVGDSDSSENVLLVLLNFIFHLGFLSRPCSLKAPAGSAHVYQIGGYLRKRTTSISWLTESNSFVFNFKNKRQNSTPLLSRD